MIRSATNEQRQRFEELLGTEQYEVAKPLMITTFERGKIAGRDEGRREVALLLLETNFGDVSAQIRERVASLSAEPSASSSK